MVEYIRGKKAYTKWDADSENVDIEYQDGTGKTFLINGSSWLSGTKGTVIKVLLLLLLFFVGFILGYVIRHAVHDNYFMPLIPNGGRPLFDYDPQQAEFLKNHVRPENIKEFLRNLSLKSHVAGTSGGNELASIIRRQWEQAGLDDVRVEKYRVLLSYPPLDGSNAVLVIDENNATVLNLTSHPANSEFKPYQAYSANGIATGRLVYVNYGRREDFEVLRHLNVTVSGAIVIARLGRTHRGDKVKLAEEMGAVGMLLYPDPADYVGHHELFPKGLGLPGNGVVYGSLKTFPGDPETPSLPSVDVSYRLLPGSDLGLPRIPVQPISYDDARTLFGSMSGPHPPDSWVGKLNVTYRVGPGFVAPDDSQLVKIEVSNILQGRVISNVIGVMYGRIEQDEYVIVGCHHDTLTTSAVDPGSGMAVMMETVQAFGALRRTGWTPSRSLIFASWDAEEFGIVGSTEWVEDHARELVENAVAYINIDSAVSGNYTLSAFGSPLLKQALYEVTKGIPSHEGDKEPLSTYDMWRLRNPQSESSRYSVPKMDSLLMGSDYVGFMAGYGVPSVHLQFVDKYLNLDYPLSHTDYDVYDAIANFVDPSFNASATLARVAAVLALKLTDSLILPLNCHDYVNTMELGLSDMKSKFEGFFTQYHIYTGFLQQAINHFDRAANIHFSNFAKVNGTDSALLYHDYNHQLMQVERALILRNGLRNSTVLRHAIFGPHADDLHEVVVFPTIVESIVRAQHNLTGSNVEHIRMKVAEVVQVLRSVGGMLISSALMHYTSDTFL